MIYFIETPANEWDVKKAFAAYLMEYDGEEVVDRMKKDLQALKDSQNVGTNLKKKIEHIRSTIDVSISFLTA